MNTSYSKINKSLFAPVMKSITELKLYEQSKSSYAKGYIYTLYNKSTDKIKIGYTDLLDRSINRIKDEGYVVLEWRIGSNNEAVLLKATLDELGYKEIRKDGTYEKSINLIHHLRILGWPLGSLIQNNRKKRWLN